MIITRSVNTVHCGWEHGLQQEHRRGSMKRYSSDCPIALPRTVLPALGVPLRLPASLSDSGAPNGRRPRSRMSDGAVRFFEAI